MSVSQISKVISYYAKLRFGYKANAMYILKAIEVPSKSSNIQIFYDPQRDRVICHYDETISFFNTNSGSEVVEISDISAIYTGNEDPSNVIPLKRRVNNEMNYIIAVDNQGNIKMINL